MFNRNCLPAIFAALIEKNVSRMRLYFCLIVYRIKNSIVCYLCSLPFIFCAWVLSHSQIKHQKEGKKINQCPDSICSLGTNWSHPRSSGILSTHTWRCPSGHALSVAWHTQGKYCQSGPCLAYSKIFSPLQSFPVLHKHYILKLCLRASQVLTIFRPSISSLL